MPPSNNSHATLKNHELQQIQLFYEDIKSHLDQLRTCYQNDHENPGCPMDMWLWMKMVITETGPSEHNSLVSAVISSWKFTGVCHNTQFNCLVGLEVRRLPQEQRSRVWIPLVLGFFGGRVIPVIQKLPFQWLSCQAPGAIGSVLGLVGQVSVYCDWVR